MKKTVLIFGLLVALVVALFVFIDPIQSSGQETCPDGEPWVKVDGLSGFGYDYTAPDGKLVAETCYKAGEVVEFELIDPPQKSVTIISQVKFELSHISVRLVLEPTNTPEPTNTNTVVPSSTPTEIVTNTPKVTNTPQATFTPTFVFTPTATIPFTIQRTPTDIPEPSNTPTATLMLQPTPTDPPAGGNGPLFLSMFGQCSSCLPWIILSAVLIIITLGSIAYATIRPKRG